MKMLNFLSILIIFSSALPLTAQTSFEDAVLESLRCENRPSPLPILEALESSGLIHADEMLGMDSISCFRLSEGLSIRGLTFNSICVHEEDDNIRNLRPDLLWRGPGTSPGQLLSFGTSANDQAVARWYFDNIGTRHLNEAIKSEYTNLGDRTEVKCSGWFSG
jgi:hypothetical protein